MPLTSLLEDHHRGVNTDHKVIDRSCEDCIIGNANAHMSYLRRERVVNDLNKSLLPIVGDDLNFKEAAPLLFGTEFAKKGKELVDQVRAMRSTITRKPERRPPFFRGGPPTNRGGGFNRKYRRGGAQTFRYGRERPYQMGKGPPQTNQKGRHQN